MKLARRAILKAGFYLNKLKRPSFTTEIKGMSSDVVYLTLVRVKYVGMYRCALLLLRHLMLSLCLQFN